MQEERTQQHLSHKQYIRDNLWAEANQVHDLRLMPHLVCYLVFMLEQQQKDALCVSLAAVLLSIQDTPTSHDGTCHVPVRLLIHTAC